MEKLAWFSFKRCFNLLALLSGMVSTSCTVTGWMLTAPAPDALPKPKLGSERGTKDENMVVEEARLEFLHTTRTVL